MKGIIFNSVAQAVIDLGGEDLWDDLLDAAGLQGSYTSLGSYDDGELLALIDAASKLLDKSVDETTEYLGELVFPYLSSNHTKLIADHEDTVSLLCTLNDVIHPEVLKLYPGASVPQFKTLLRDGGHLRLLYHSGRGLPALASGLIRGAAKLYGEQVSIDIESSTEGFIFDLVFVKADQPQLVYGS